MIPAKPLALLLATIAVSAVAFADRPDRRDDRRRSRAVSSPASTGNSHRAPAAREGRKGASRVAPIRTAAPAPPPRIGPAKPAAAPPLRAEPRRQERRHGEISPAVRSMPPRRDGHRAMRPVRPHRELRRDVKVIRVVRPAVPRKIVEVVHVYRPTVAWYLPADRETFYVTFVNRTNRTLDLELEGPHEGEEDLGTLRPGEAMRYPLVVRIGRLPETFELEAGPYEVNFTLDPDSPRDFALILTPEGAYAE